MLLLRSIPELEPFDLTPTIGNAGSTVDAMSDAIEGADVMIYGVSLAYKESANVSALRDLSVVELSVVRHRSALMFMLSCVLQCRMGKSDSWAGPTL